MNYIESGEFWCWTFRDLQQNCIELFCYKKESDGKCIHYLFD